MSVNSRLVAAFCIMLGAVVWASCEKMVPDDDNTAGQAENNANLVLRVGMPGARAGEGNGAPWSTLMFEIYQDNSKKKDIVQHAGDEGYGTAAVSLSPGNYQVLVLAHGSEGNPSRPRPTEIEFSNKTGYSDTFYYYSDIAVGEQPEEHTVALQRATSKIHFVTSDALPPEVKSVRFYYEGGSSTLNALTGYGYKKSKQTFMFDVDETMAGKPLAVDLYTFLRDDEAMLALTVSAYASERAAAEVVLLKERVFSVPAYHRQITNFSGRFFSDESEVPDTTAAVAASQSFVIVADTAWAGTHNHTF